MPRDIEPSAIIKISQIKYSARGGSIAKILVTAALPYANGPLHLGHIRSTYLPADIYARFQRLVGNEVRYICATDEHGTPIVASAERDGKTPAEFVNYYHERDKREFRALGFSMDIFHRTSSEENKKMTQYFFARLKENGYIYEKKVSQPYCEKCKRFLPDRFVVGVCPFCGAPEQYSDYCDACGKVIPSGGIKEPKCIVCGYKPVMRESEHYFFALSKFSEKLLAWFDSNKNLQKEVVNYVKDWIKSGLNDWDITRDMSWGVPVPGKNLVFYVWFDAPIGYVSSTSALMPNEWEKWWKGDAKIVHFIGKDIIYHHFLFWPAMLMGVGDGFSLPDAIPVRGYLNLEQRKFSKSKGWFVSLEDYLKEFEPDYLRYYETMITPHSVEDADFVWRDFQNRVNNELVANIGNFIHRTLVLIKKLYNGRIPKTERLDTDDNSILEIISETKNDAAKKIEAFDLKGALESICALSTALNRYMSAREPWKEKDEARRAACLYVCTRGVTALGIMLYPFLPFSSEKLFSMLGIDAKKIKWDDADRDMLTSEMKIGDVSPLFKKIEDSKIMAQERKLGGG